MNDLCSLTLCDAATLLRQRKLGVLELVDACLARIEATEPVIEALLASNAENARSLAREMDKRGPDPEKPLWGVPVTIKDALSTKGLATTAASRILENFVPIYDAFVVERMKAAGAIILAKNNMDEFAMGSSTENSAYKKTRNPWNTGKVPGGSSGGSAASVAAGQCFASLGSDTGGSIRQPASFCGCVGIKPTYGRVSRYGLFAFASSLDQVGPIARTVKDCAQTLQVIAGHDKRDNASSPAPVPNYLEKLEIKTEKPLHGVKLGIPLAMEGLALSADVLEAWQRTRSAAQELGAELLDIKLPDADIAIAVYYIVAMAEASSNLARYDGVRYGRRAGGVTTLDELYTRSRSEGFGDEVKRRIMLGAYVLSSGYYDAYYRKAAKTRRLVRQSYLEALEKCDALLMPVAPETAWAIGRHDADPASAYLMDALTLPANLAGLPALAFPAGLSATGMPTGAQLIGKPFAEADLLFYGHALESVLPSCGQPAFLQSLNVN